MRKCALSPLCSTPVRLLTSPTVLVANTESQQQAVSALNRQLAPQAQERPDRVPVELNCMDVVGLAASPLDSSLGISKRYIVRRRIPRRVYLRQFELELFGRVET
ncbi:hypothetical protein BKA57DRAFT_433111 [Linnemannia elongata]|nr:hypothetical protein BKA57DRAFT_433111 [Linnemannia elongata]